VFQSATDLASRLVWFDGNGKPLGRISGTGLKDPRLSPDGRRLAITSDDAHNGSHFIRVYDLARGVSTRVTDSGQEEFPFWGSDGKSIVYMGRNRASACLCRVPADASSAPTTLLEGAVMPNDWTRHLAPTFGGAFRAELLTGAAVAKYAAARREAGAAIATTNRELALLRRALRLGYESEPQLVRKVPKIRLLPGEDANARQEFASAEQLERLRQEAAKHSLWLRTFLELASTIGWRHRELLNLRVSMFDKVDGTLTLPGAMNGL
jgi:hypothetical protein